MTEGLVPVIDLEPVLLKENPTEEIDNAKETRELQSTATVLKSSVRNTQSVLIDHQAKLKLCFRKITDWFESSRRHKRRELNLDKSTTLSSIVITYNQRWFEIYGA